MRSGYSILFKLACIAITIPVWGQNKQASLSFNLTDTPSCHCNLTVTSTIQPASSCDRQDGGISVAVTGGSGQYNYSWSNQSGTLPGTSGQLNNLAPGSYFVQVTDAQNSSCATLHSAHIGSDITLTIVPVLNSNCSVPTGGLALTVNGGSGNFDYEWTFPDGSVVKQEDLTNVKAGQYSVKVTDKEKGCTVTKAATVRNAAGLGLTVISNKENTSCLSPDGQVQIGVTNGSGQYDYYWYDTKKSAYVSYTKDLTNVAGGNYSIYVVDKVSGCIAYELISVTEETVTPNFTLQTVANTNCGDSFNGAIDLEPFGTTGPYLVSWTDGLTTISTEEDPSGLAPGKYGFTLTDVTTGCSTVYSVNDSDPVVIADESLTEVSVSAEVINNTDCQDPNGAIQVTLQNPNQHPYTLSWSGPKNFSSLNEDISNLKGGVYTLHLEIACSPNRPPVIEPLLMPVNKNTPATINLFDIISDADGNLNMESIQIISPPPSGATWTLTEGGILTIDYAKLTFTGKEELQIQACDLMNTCTQGTLTLDIKNQEEIIVYNAIAPTSAGDNKFMRILNLPNAGNKVSIFNRWGDRVFEVFNYDNNLTGKRFEGLSDTGQELPSGTYFYKIELANNGKVITGYLALKR